MDVQEHEKAAAPFHADLLVAAAAAAAVAEAVVAKTMRPATYLRSSVPALCLVAA